MSEPNEETWIPLTGITTITFRLPGGGHIRVCNNLDSDDGIAQVDIEVGRQQTLVRFPLDYRDDDASHMTTLVVYGPHDGEPGHYNPDGTQVKGKCSSTESLYTSPVNVDYKTEGTNGVASAVYPAAQPDGSYGQNEAAIYCFLDDSNQTMMEFNTNWIWVEKPITGFNTVQGSAVIPNGK